jgi:hypothetical protein
VQLLDADGGDLVSRFHNLGEDAYRELGGLGTVSLQEIDISTDAFHVRDVRKRHLGTVTQLLERIIRRNMVDGSIELIRED